MSPVKIVAVVLLVSLMLAIGFACNREHLLATLKNYGLIGRALLANFVVVPILGVLLVRIFRLDEYVATGFLLMAIAPGVPFVVAAGGRKKGGSLGFAIALAFIMPALSVITVPFTAQLVLPASQEAHLPAAQFLTTLLLFQLVPLLIGMLVAGVAPALASKLERPFMLIFLVAVVVLLAMLTPTIAKSVATVFGSRGIMAMIVIAILSVITGWLLGGPESQYRRTLSIGTTLRNIGLCALIATTNFPDTPVPAAVMTYLLVQALVAAIVGAYFTRTAKPAAAAA